MGGRKLRKLGGNHRKLAFFWGGLGQVTARKGAVPDRDKSSVQKLSKDGFEHGGLSEHLLRTVREGTTPEPSGGLPVPMALTPFSINLNQA